MACMFDTHAHLDGEEFDSDRRDVVDRALTAGVKAVLVPNIDLKSLQKLESVCEEYKGFFFPMIGLHPENVAEMESNDLELFEARLSETSKFVGIGEIGLDFYWDETFRERQMDVFDEQLQMALRHDLPVMIHARNAEKEIIDVLQQYRGKGLKGVFHCFTGGEEYASQLLTFDGFCLGVGGVLTFKKSTLPDTLAAVVPVDRIVLETDSPYMAPAPNRGKRNESSFVLYVANKLADIYQISLEQVQRQTSINAAEIFNCLAPFLDSY